MSEAVSACQGAKFAGAIRVEDAGVQGMITLRGDLSDENLAKAVKSVTGLAMPAARGVKRGAKGGVAWMSPDELLLFVDYEAADAMVEKLNKALAGGHFLAVNVSDARAMFSLTGTGVRDVIAKGSPANLDPVALPEGKIRRSRIGQLAVAFWFDAPDQGHIVCFRSVGAHIFNWLSVASESDTLPGVH